MIGKRCNRETCSTGTKLSQGIGVLESQIDNKEDCISQLEDKVQDRETAADWLDEVIDEEE